MSVFQHVSQGPLPGVPEPPFHELRQLSPPDFLYLGFFWGSGSAFGFSLRPETQFAQNQLGANFPRNFPLNPPILPGTSPELVKICPGESGSLSGQAPPQEPGNPAGSETCRNTSNPPELLVSPELPGTFVRKWQSASCAEASAPFAAETRPRWQFPSQSPELPGIGPELLAAAGRSKSFEVG